MTSIVEEYVVELSEPSDNAQVIYVVRRMTMQAGFDDVQQALIATAASELSTNIIRYAGKGYINLRIVMNDQKSGIEIKASDDGPGIADIESAMKENYSTGNSLGLGLPSVKRIMDEFELNSEIGRGTVIIARKWR